MNVAGRVSLRRMSEIVLDKFADGDMDDALRLMRRALFRMHAAVDARLLDDLFDRDRTDVSGVRLAFSRG